MAYKIIGKQINNGVFNGKPYENLVLHCIDQNPCSNTTLVGERVFSAKIKVDPSKFYNEIEIGSIVDFYYDRFGSISSVSFK